MAEPSNGCSRVAVGANSESIVTHGNTADLTLYAARNGSLSSPGRFMAAAVLISAFAAVMYLFAPRQPAYAPEIVESSAIAMIDFAELHSDLLSFIDLLRNNQVVGHSTSEFPNLWQHTISDMEDTESVGIVWYYFTLPVTAEQKVENEEARGQAAGVPCWPMLSVRVDKKQSVIVKAALYTQCL